MNVTKLFEAIPVLNTSRLVLKEITLEEAESLFQIYSSKEVVQFCDLSSHQKLSDSRNFILEIKESLKNKNKICWGAYHTSNNQLVGLCRFYNYNAKHQFISIGFELSREFWGQGLMKEALTEVISYLFNGSDINRIEAQVYTGNKRSVKLLEKIGFKKEGVMRQNFLIEGTLRNSLLYSLVKGDLQ